MTDPKQAPTLTVGAHTLEARHTDTEIISALSKATYAYSPMFGLEGGDLGRLLRHVRGGTETIPGRGPMRSEELIWEALAQARERAARLEKELRPLERQIWWAQHGAQIGIIVLVLACLGGAGLILKHLAGHAGDSPVAPNEVQQISATFWSYVVPGTISALVLVGLVTALAYALRRH